MRSDYEVLLVASTPETLDYLRSIDARRQIEWIDASDHELQEVGSFQTNDGAIAIAKIKPVYPLELKSGEFGLILDDIRDPGNLGTIIRTADWYGLTKIIASEETTDLYNPKVIAATMGSFTRVQVYYTNLEKFLKGTKAVSYGTFLEGTSIYDAKFTPGWIVIGNESLGISKAVEPFIKHRITIPRIGKAESLNAGIATAIVLDNMARLKK